MSPVFLKLYVEKSGDLALLFLSVFVVFPHLFYLPGLLIGFCLMIWILNLILLIKGIRLVRWIKFGIIVLAIFTLAWASQQMVNINLGVSLLCLIIAIKPLESHTPRDKRIFALLGYFTSITYFFYEQNGWWFLYYCFYLILLTTFVLSIEFPAAKTQRLFKESLWLLLQTIPLVIILFFTFPRLSQPFWQWNPGEEKSITGLSEQMHLDDLNALSLSDEVAFTVRFEPSNQGGSATQMDLYWRGPVFYFSNGRVWDSDYYLKQPMPDEHLKWDRLTRSEGNGSLLEPAPDMIRYRVNMQPSGQKWLFALDLPLMRIKNAVLSEDYQLISDRPIRSPIVYSAASVIDFTTPRDKDHIYRMALQLPYKPRMARKARQFGQVLREAYQGENQAQEKIIQQALLYFAQQPFFYTREPVNYITNPIDDFLFDGRKGYCSHYASALTIILRAAGIPARMITGYRGGDWSEQRSALGNEKILTIKQKHAHAWVEAWVDQFGWVRLDPTQMIPPERVLEKELMDGDINGFNQNISTQIESLAGLNQFFQQNRKNLAVNSSNPTKIQGDNETDNFPQLMGHLGNYFWETWIKDFDYQRQQQMLVLFGYPISVLWLLILLVLLSLAFYMILVLYLSRTMRSRKKQSIQSLYQQLCDSLSRQGIEMLPHESHRALFQRLVKMERYSSKQLEWLFKTYERLRYAQNETQMSKQELALFKKSIRQLKKRVKNK